MIIALLQLNPTVGDIQGNADKILHAARQAREQGASLAVTTKMALVGYPPRDLLLFDGFVRDSLQAMERLARDLPPELAVLAGGVEPSSGPGAPLRNTAFLLQGGRIQRRFAKKLLPTYDVFDERRYFEPSLARNMLRLGDHAIGVTICEDVWNDAWAGPRHLYGNNPLDDLASGDERADVLINLSASPFCVGKQRLRESMLSALAAKYRACLLYANQAGGNDDLLFDGRSTAFGPDGELMGRAKAFGEDILLVNVDARRSTIAPPVDDELDEALEALTLGLRDYTSKCGFHSVLLGLSGGVDSSLTAALAVRALGPDKVLGVLMPSPFTSEQSVADARRLARNLGIQTRTLPIEPLMRAFDHALAEPFAGRQRDVTEENIQARIRGDLLMALSNKFGAMLLTTGNKSELAVGYCTLYGDMSGGLAVISDAPKTMVFALCRRINAEAGRDVIPESVLTKPPSAELRPDQRDQDSLPPYDVLDQILELHIEQRKSFDEIVSRGFDPAIADKVIRLVKNAEFKRRQA
ncbi:MAG: NAD+ synthase, partial [Desulfovibrionaceae bacterium]